MSEVAIVVIGFFAGMLVGVPTGLGIAEILRLRGEIRETKEVPP